MKVTMAQVTDAKDFVNAVVEFAPPSGRKWLADRLESFLAHYFTAAAGEKLNAMVAHDWILMLQDFPAPCIDKAVVYWLKNENRRPKIAEIRDLAITYFGIQAWQNLERARIVSAIFPSREEPQKAGEKKESWIPPTAEQKARVAEICKGIGRNLASNEREGVNAIKGESA